MNSRYVYNLNEICEISKEINMLKEKEYKKSCTINNILLIWLTLSNLLLLPFTSIIIAINLIVLFAYSRYNIKKKNNKVIENLENRIDILVKENEMIKSKEKETKIVYTKSLNSNNKIKTLVLKKTN